VWQRRRARRDVVCLPELFQTQYFCQREDARCSISRNQSPARPPKTLAAAARKNKVVLIASLFEKRAPGVYHNTAAIFDGGGDSDGRLAGIYRKMHIPDDPLYYEKFYFTPGDLGFKAFDTSAGKLGTLICWDQWYPEAARLTRCRELVFCSSPQRSDGSCGEGQIWRVATRCLADDSRAHAIATGLRRGRESRRLLRPETFAAIPCLAKAGILGRSFFLRSFRPRSRRGFA